VGDLWWWTTAVTRAQAFRTGVTPPRPLPTGADEPCLDGIDELLPVTGLSWSEAVVVAHGLGGRLPTSAEWEWMAGAGVRRYPWGQAEPTGRHANLRATGPSRTTVVGSYPLGTTVDGLCDVAGNVWEWTASRVPGGGAIVRGGSYHSLPLYARCMFVNEIPVETVSAGVGLRPVTDP
jgi:iron(II)-dependent oxidoreductase